MYLLSFVVNWIKKMRLALKAFLRGNRSVGGGGLETIDATTLSYVGGVQRPNSDTATYSVALSAGKHLIWGYLLGGNSAFISVSGETTELVSTSSASGATSVVYLVDVATSETKTITLSRNLPDTVFQQNIEVVKIPDDATVDGLADTAPVTFDRGGVVFSVTSNTTDAYEYETATPDVVAADSDIRSGEWRQVALYYDGAGELTADTSGDGGALGSTASVHAISFS